MEKIKEAIGLAKWWIDLPPQKKLLAYMLAGIVTLLFVINVLWKTNEGNNTDNKVDYAQCKEENKRWSEKYSNLESDFRNYLMENNRRKEETTRQNDSLIKVVESKKQ